MIQYLGFFDIYPNNNIYKLIYIIYKYKNINCLLICCSYYKYSFKYDSNHISIIIYYYYYYYNSS